MIRKKIRLTGLVLSVAALAAFLIACSNPAGPAGNRQTGQVQEPIQPTQPGETVYSQLEYLEGTAQSGGIYVVVARANEPPIPGGRFSISPASMNNADNITITIVSEFANTRQTLNLDTNGHMLQVEGTNTLILQNIILHGRSSNNVALVQVNSGGTLEMRNNSVISGNNGTGVAVSGTDASFTMIETSEIRNNRVGLSVSNAGTATLSGNAAISANSGTGMNITSGRVHMYNRAEISNNGSNTATGGVLITGGGILVMSGNTEIHNNNGRSIGGVFSANNSRLFMHDNATIRNNNGLGGDTYGAGGIGLQQGARVYMHGNASIRNNTNSSDSIGGGGVSIFFDGSLTMHGDGVRISGNSIVNDQGEFFGQGGGVLIGSGGGIYLNISNGIIHGYSAPASYANRSATNQALHNRAGLRARVGTYTPSGIVGVAGTFTPNASIPAIPSTNNTIRVWNNGNDREGW